MPQDPLARLNLSPRPIPLPAESAPAAEPAGAPAFPTGSPADAHTPPVPDFPPVVADSRAALTVTPPPSAPATPLAMLTADLAAPAAPALSDLDRYRLENDRELLRQIAYRRHFLNREE